MVTVADNKIQTPFRLPLSLVQKLKDISQEMNKSMNEYVTELLIKATEDVVTEKERRLQLEKTSEFLSTFAGAWVGEESADEIIESIREGRTVRNIVEL